MYNPSHRFADIIQLNLHESALTFRIEICMKINTSVFILDKFFQPV